TAEALYSNGEYDLHRFWDVYLMGVYEIRKSFYVVARYEHYDPLGVVASFDIGDFGLGWTPWPFLNVKAGYRVSNREAEQVTRGFTASISFLF
ncbi:MAG: hypothetical protein O7G30_06120, partial [Proteobacteria bacterium]|nr:hypothetical protein [Pseudomonadota bacterium]